MRKAKPSETGQVIVEYMLMLFLVIGAMTAFSIGIRQSIKKIWGPMAAEIARPAPGARTPDDPRF